MSHTLPLGQGPILTEGLPHHLGGGGPFENRSSVPIAGDALVSSYKGGIGSRMCGRLVERES